jgi:hypothetical protein
LARVFPFYTPLIDRLRAFNGVDRNLRADAILKMLKTGLNKSSVMSDVLFALLTSVVSGCLGGMALILLVLALNNF